MNMFNKDDGKKKEKTMPFSPASFKKSGSFGKATSTFMERIKKLSNKDLAFVLMGVTALITAPVAQYFLSAPPQDNLLTPGFSTREGEISVFLNNLDRIFYSDCFFHLSARDKILDVLD